MRKFLVIQQKMIGDVLVGSILCETLVAAYPDAQVDYLIHQNTWPVIQENAKQYRVILFSEQARKSRRGFLRFARKIRDEHYDVIIDAYSKPESWGIVALSGAKRKISFKKRWTNWLYTDVVTRHLEPVSTLGLAIEHRLQLLQPLGIAHAHYVTHPKIEITEPERQQALAMLQQHGLGDGAGVVVVNILGSAAEKTYPAAYMARIVDALAQHDVQIVFNYLPKQAGEAQEIVALCQPATQARIYLDVLTVDLRRFLAIMSQCRCIIGNDGGAMNMAKALGKPTFIIFSPWIEKKVWATFEDGCNHVSVHLHDFMPELLAGKAQKDLRKDAANLYSRFLPGLFSRQLDAFCRRHLA